MLQIKDGPLGIGITGTAASSVWSLSIYFLLAFLYFNRDQSDRYIPAVTHMGWRAMIWIFWHIPLFSSLLTLSAGFMFLIRQDVTKPENGKGFEIPEDEVDSYIHRTIWLVATSLAVIVASMTMQALLDIPRDPPGALLINNRYIRLSGRLVFILIILLVPLHPDLNKVWFLGIAGIGLSLVMYWEWVVCLEKKGGFIEPKGLTVMMKRELGAKELATDRRLRQD